MVSNPSMREVSGNKVSWSLEIGQEQVGWRGGGGGYGSKEGRKSCGQPSEPKAVLAAGQTTHNGEHRHRAHAGRIFLFVLESASRRVWFWPTPSRGQLVELHLEKDFAAGSPYLHPNFPEAV